MSTDVTGILRQTDLLRSVPAKDIEAIAAASRLRTFRRGQVLFTTGDPADTLIVVISGRVKVVVRSADGGELTLTIVPPGGVFGELSVADGGPRSADAETLEECRLLFVPRETIHDISSRVPSVAQALASAPIAVQGHQVSQGTRRTCRAYWRRGCAAMASISWPGGTHRSHTSGLAFLAASCSSRLAAPWRWACHMPNFANSPFEISSRFLRGGATKPLLVCGA
jgi:hypothetical protein